jgi:tRNA U34 5-methylaminomethyl-2-thiouridine-forming methyltransferase MnmC
MEKIITADGSETFFNEKVGESYHSKTGAVEESFEKFVKPLGVFFSKKPVRILDVCFGLGYNSAAALDHFDNCKVTGIEKDEGILKRVFEVDPGFENYNEIRLAVRGESDKIRLIVGDALKEVKKLDGEFQVVLFDPFSPKKAPEMWTEQFFKDIRAKMAKNGVLTTYSCAKSVRENLKKAGFEVKDGPKVGRRGPSTIAVNADY